MDSGSPRSALIVSCDVVGHGADVDLQRQIARIKGLNDCIRQVCAPYFGGDAIWASGGDGGHLVLLGDAHGETALKLMATLFRWANSQTGGAIRLRLTGHHGPVAILEGADGRRELTGDGINLSGGLLGFGVPGAVVVTAAFRNEIERLRPHGTPLVSSAIFSGERSIYLKHHRAHTVMHLSIPGVFSSPSEIRVRSDRSMLHEALLANQQWSAIYHAKRLLQIDSSDRDAVSGLQSINPANLVVHGREPGRIEAHPLFSPMNRQSMLDLVHSAHLVERDDGETICVQDDPGDAMFVVLKGQIGVVLPPQNNGADAPRTAPVDLSFGEGTIVGELALALNRRRTATLQAIGPTALLAINYNTLQGLLSATPKNVRLERTFNEFLLNRSLSFVCSNCHYLAKGPSAPLASLDHSWERLAEDSEQFTLDWKNTDCAAALRAKFKSPGLYLLACGRLIESSRSDVVNKRLDATDFPIVFVNLPNAVVSHCHDFTFDPEAGLPLVKIIHVSDRALMSQGPAVYARLVEAIKRQLASQFLFDVFISYTNKDEQIASIWRQQLELAGLRVYMSRPEAMRRFKSEIELALAESLVMIPFVSERAAGPDGQPGWVQREIGYRKTLFDEAHCNILPIELTRGLAQSFADGFSAIAVTGNGEECIPEAVAAVLAVRNGRTPPPFATQYVDKLPI